MLLFSLKLYSGRSSTVTAFIELVVRVSGKTRQRLRWIMTHRGSALFWAHQVIVENDRLRLLQQLMTAVSFLCVPILISDLFSVLKLQY